MLARQNIITKLIPYALILVCLAVLSRFFIEPFLFPVNLDDCMYNALLNTYSFPELMQMLPGDCNGHLFSHFDGRMFSNLYSLIVFTVFKHHWASYYIYTLFLLLVLIWSLYSLFNSLIKNNVLSYLSSSKRILLSSYTACLLFIFLLDGRYEVFYWISSTSNHLLSIIFFILILGLLVEKTTLWRTTLLFILCFCTGQMNEVYAFSYICILLFLAVMQRRKRLIYLLLILSILSALTINLSSPGTVTRFNILYDISTHFNLRSSIEDTWRTFLLPFINYRYLPIKIPAVILFFIALTRHFKIRLNFRPGRLLVFNRLLLLLAITSVFLHCYIMGEVCTYRGLLFLSLCLAYFIFVMAGKNSLNPLKLFLH